tara:strand:+ start:3952 stop:4833 length:882 start_codon:yes stop_codon:yes gene_type:complete
MTVAKNLNIARAVFATLSATLALITLITFGADMDSAHFPGATLVLDTYTEGDNADLAGQLKQVFGGFRIKDSSAVCTNFVGPTELKESGMPVTTPCDYYKESEKTFYPLTKSKNSKVVNSKYRGWVVAPSCAKTDDTGDCAPFGYMGPLSVLGATTFGIFAIRAILFGAHTCVMLLSDNVSLQTAIASKGKQRAFLGLNIFWMIISFSLFVWAALAWQGMCDKIDTGLGRVVKDGSGQVQACATSYCGISFGGFFASYAVALLWFRIPNILIWAGIVDGPDNKYKQIDDDDDE